MKHIKTISEFHAFRHLPPPDHPLISVIDVSQVPHVDHDEPDRLMLDFYSIALKRMHNFKMMYGQQPFDFNEGILSFIAPKQVFGISRNNNKEEIKKSGWVIYIHPDFIWNTPLAKIIKGYDFWDYSLNEALFLSAKEEAVAKSIIANIHQECQANIDKFTKQIIISQLESLLSYADRFYHRQFITREKLHHDVLVQLETELTNYFNSDAVVKQGLPTVQNLAAALHLSPKYLSSLLKTLTGLNTQQHIHEHVIALAKEKLSTTGLSVSEIAYALGFEHLQSFSKLFKSKTNCTPLAFRAAFN